MAFFCPLVICIPVPWECCSRNMGTWFKGQGGLRLKVGLHHLEGVFQASHFCAFMSWSLSWVRWEGHRAEHTGCCACVLKCFRAAAEFPEALGKAVMFLPGSSVVQHTKICRCCWPHSGTPNPAQGGCLCLLLPIGCFKVLSSSKAAVPGAPVEFELSEYSPLCQSK